MAKFVIECPKCGKYAQARSGFFAQKKVECACGHIIDIRAEKLTSRVCPHCGNDVVFDQSKGEKARCPVCHEPINTMADQTKLVEFSCKQCGVSLSTAKGVSSYICPVCDHVNDVAEQLSKEAIRKEGVASIIKYEGNNETLVWKHPVEDFNLGSQLIVHESQEAIFFRDGQALDLFGAGRYTLETQQLPILEKFYSLPSNMDSPFHSEVYFINMATQMGVKWGTDTKVRMFDPITGMHMELGASGEFNIRVINSRKLLLKLVGTTGGLTQDQLLGNNGKGFFRAMVMTQVKSYLASSIRENNINILEIDEWLMKLSEALRNRINPQLADYGLEVTELFINRVVTPDDDPNFRRVKQQYAEQYLNVRQEQVRKNIAQAEAERKTAELEANLRLKSMSAQGDVDIMRIKAEAEAEILRLKAEAEAEAMKAKSYAAAEGYRAQAMAEAAEMQAKGYTYQQESARQIGMQAMKNGLTGNEGGGVMGSMLGGIGELAGLGVSLGAMGSVMGMTKDVLSPVMDAASQMGQGIGGAIKEVPASGWECSCGAKNIQSKFCPECGAKKPELKQGWDCPMCGTKNIESKFCPECGARKPEQPQGWNCPECGTKNIMSKFCPECGCKKPEPKTTWDCPECGNKEISAKFCPECGHKREG